MLERLRRRVPKGKKLPDLTKVATFVALKTKDPRPLTHEALAGALVPFVVLGDGGVVALWYRDAAEPPVVHVSSEGEHRVFLFKLRETNLDFTNHIIWVQEFLQSIPGAEYRENI